MIEKPDLSWTENLGDIDIEMSGGLQDLMQELTRYIQSVGDLNPLNTESWISTYQKMMKTVKAVRGESKSDESQVILDQNETIQTEPKDTESPRQSKLV